MPFKHLAALVSSIVLFGSLVAPLPLSAQTLKTAKLCNDEYAAQKPANETKKEFVAARRALPIGTDTGR